MPAVVLVRSDAPWRAQGVGAIAEGLLAQLPPLPRRVAAAEATTPSLHGPPSTQVTGCSTGLGRALAVECAQQRDTQGEPLFQVYASARRLEALADLPPQVRRAWAPQPHGLWALA